MQTSFQTLQRFRKRPNKDLPVEIILHILQFVSRSDLRTFMRVSRQAQSIAQPILYRHLDFKADPIRTLLLCTTLIARHDLAALVLSLDISTPSYRLESLKLLLDMDNMILKVIPLLLNLGELTIFSFHGHLRGHPLCPNEMLRTLTSLPLILHKLEYTGKNDGAAELGVLIQRFPTITHLELPLMMDDVEEITKHQGCIPNLNTFIGEPQVAARIVPGRPVASVTLTATSATFVDDHQEVFRALSKSTRNIRYLSLNLRTVVWDLENWADGGGLVASLIQHLPDLEELRFNSRMPEAAWRSLIQQIPHVIGNCPSLSTISLESSGGFDFQPFSDTKSDHSLAVGILSSWSDACPSFNRFVFANGCRWSRRGLEWIGSCRGNENCTGSAKALLRGTLDFFLRDLPVKMWQQRQIAMNAHSIVS